MHKGAKYAERLPCHKGWRIIGIQYRITTKKTLEQISTQKMIDSLEYSTTGLGFEQWLRKDKSLIVGVI